MADYRTLITTVGQSKLAAAILGDPLVISTMAVGDANGVGYDPAEAQLALVNQVYTADVDTVETLAGGVIVVEMTIPADQGGWHVREAAVKDADGDVIAIVRIADRYKPLPASGQADELTIRMKLDVGNVGNVTWNVDLTRKAKIDGQLRPDFRSVEAVLNDPPGAPVAGETWIVGAAPTGAWVGHENELAEWSGSGWTFIPPTPWMHVGLADKADWRWDHTLDPAAWVVWKPWPSPATILEADEATRQDVYISPQTLTQKAAVYISARSATQPIPSGVYTVITSMTTLASNLDDATYAGGALTIGTKTAGKWDISTNVMLGTLADGSIVKMFISLNGANIAFCDGGQATNSTNTSTPGVALNLIFDLAEGDVVRFGVQHDDGATQPTFDLGTFFNAVRLGA